MVTQNKYSTALSKKSLFRRIGTTISALNNGYRILAKDCEDIYKLFFSVKPEYRTNGSWMVNDETALYLRNLKDDTGNFLWRGGADTLMGKPVVISNEMPSIGVGANPVAFGDFSYYWVVDRKLVSVRTLKEKFTLHAQIGYLAFEFVDGRLVRPDAVKVIQIA